MTENSNQILWDKIKYYQLEVDKLKYQMGQLDLLDQIEILKYAFSIDDGVNVWNHLLTVEPIDYRNSDRKLTKGLFEIIVSAAVNLSKNALDAQALLAALVIDFPSYRELIYFKVLHHLDNADKTSDYEVYQGSCDLLIQIKSEHLDEFLKRCREHSNAEIREIDEDWD